MVGHGDKKQRVTGKWYAGLPSGPCQHSAPRMEHHCSGGGEKVGEEGSLLNLIPGIWLMLEFGVGIEEWAGYQL